MNDKELVVLMKYAIRQLKHFNKLTQDSIDKLKGNKK